jgi:hypothetical protein
MGNRQSARVLSYEAAMSRLGSGAAETYERAYRRLAARPGGGMAPLSHGTFLRYVLAGVPDIPPALGSRLFACFDPDSGSGSGGGGGAAGGGGGAEGLSLEDFVVSVALAAGRHA